MSKTNFLGISPEITEYNIASERLPKSFDNFRIAQISDTHSYPSGKIFELIEPSKPDIICITGDMFHDDGKDAPDFWALLEKLLTLAPVYLVTGNHDLWRGDCAELLQKIRDLGGIILNSEMSVLEKDGEKIAIFGVGDPFSKVPKIMEKNIIESFSRLPHFDGYRILLYHRANLFDKIKDFGFDLILSGHMHGGQIRILGLGGLCAPTSALLSGRMIFPQYTAGKFEYNNSVMIVNRGASNTLPIPRFCNPPEVCIITLLHKNKA